MCVYVRGEGGVGKRKGERAPEGGRQKDQEDGKENTGKDHICYGKVLGRF